MDFSMDFWARFHLGIERTVWDETSKCYHQNMRTLSLSSLHNLSTTQKNNYYIIHVSIYVTTRYTLTKNIAGIS